MSPFFLVFLAAAPTLSAAAAPARPVAIVASAAPLLGLVDLSGRVGLSPAFTLELTGWNAFRTDQGAFTRGAFLGGQLTVLHNDALDLVAGLRVFAAQEATDGKALGGLGGRVETRLKLSPTLTMRPDFDLTWLGPLVSARFTNELAVTLGEWRLGGQAGVQVWVRDADTQVAPAVALSVGLRHAFSAVTLDVGAALGLTRDSSFLLQHPVLATPRAELGFDAALHVGLTL
jgi:hypothetical protein